MNWKKRKGETGGGIHNQDYLPEVEREKKRKDANTMGGLLKKNLKGWAKAENGGKKKKTDKK